MKAFKNKKALGFTVAETVIALSVSSLVILGVMMFYRGVMIHAQGGSAQCRYMAMARRAQQQLASFVREGKAVGVETNRIVILLKTDGFAAIEYVDEDNNPLTVTNNIIRYDPDVWVSGDEIPVCSYVRQVDGQTAIFSVVPNSPASARIEFHVGDSTDPRDISSVSSGAGYQGYEVRFSVAPRNLQYWYQ